MEDLRKFEIPGHVEISGGNGGLPKLRITTGISFAEIYLHGAHVTAFQKGEEPPVLFVSAESHFEAGMPIRGGVPVIFPWFGPREGLPSHGFARTVEWYPKEVSLLPDGKVKVRLGMPAVKPYDVEYIVTVGETLEMELIVLNGGEKETEFETCLHAYFHVGLIDSVSVGGLRDDTYFNQLTKENSVETGETIRIREEVDRIFLDTRSAVEIEDASLGRKIIVSKSGSLSTVVWNPWVDKSRAMPDFGDGEFRHMVCIEPGNIGKNRINLLPGQSAVLKVTLDSVPLE